MVHALYHDLDDEHFEKLSLRHGQSLGNVDPKNYVEMGEALVPLSELGRQQAHGAGQFLKHYYSTDSFIGRHEARVGAREKQIAAYQALKERDPAGFDLLCSVIPSLATPPKPISPKCKIIAWHSPFPRALQTCEIACEPLHNLNHLELVVRSSHQLGERIYGHYNMVRAGLIPPNLDHQHMKRVGGTLTGFYTPMPGGNSEANVMEQLHTQHDREYRDRADEDAAATLDVFHGDAMRQDAALWLHRPDIMHDQNPGNCHVWRIAGCQKTGYNLDKIYTGKHAEIEAAARLGKRQGRQIP